jgi:hypothetical protein
MLGALGRLARAGELGEVGTAGRRVCFGGKSGAGVFRSRECREKNRHGLF